VCSIHKKAVAAMSTTAFVLLAHSEDTKTLSFFASGDINKNE
jgi:hypothetical protein